MLHNFIDFVYSFQHSAQNIHGTSYHPWAIIYVTENCKSKQESNQCRTKKEKLSSNAASITKRG